MKKRKEKGEASSDALCWLPGAILTLVVSLALMLLAALALRQEWLGWKACAWLPAGCLLAANFLGSSLTAQRATGKRLLMALFQGAVIYVLLLLANGLFVSEGFLLSEMVPVGCAVVLSSLLGGVVGAARPKRRKKR